MGRNAIAVALLLGLGVVAIAQATPVIDSAIINTRIFNDDPTSVLTTWNDYPTSLWIQDASLDGDGAGGWANRHNFRLSDTGGVSEAVFMNGDAFEFYSDVTLTGTADMEGGLNLSPWWSQQVDGVFMLRTSDGEISCWGGRLPFYNFTAEQGLTYTLGETVRLGMIYDPNSLTEEDPATIEYLIWQGGTQYTSGPRAFDMGNPDEEDPYGLWGILNDARVGGWFQPQIDVADPDNWGRIDFGTMEFVPEPAALVLLGVMGLAVVRRR